ncbi:sensor domain-containing diguanylate cyclase [Pseudonocardia broussonetiae]|uniref:GGDEF domain-containing protein n=1 Tax=Pseudonocardia broussonetiae TaxID=2736640 RepID=A0A6M6JQC7_9PSEU|nr:GGDEF domain-containing protein [Pseudonocardia broussonetiae]QJY49456.1 GGDEF domain-containing protein [Pseudonocardia broussonetiae]
MSPGRSTAGAGPGSGLPGFVAGWAIWNLPARLMAAVLTVEITAVALVLVLAVGEPGPDSRTIRDVVLLVVFGLLHTEIAHGVERVRRRVNGEVHVNLSSVWFFAATVLLPPVWAALVAVVVHLHLWLRSARPRNPLFKHVFSSATVVLSCMSASGVMSAVAADGTGDRGDVYVLALGVLVFLTVNTALVAGVIAVNSPQTDVASIVGEWDENLLEIATLCLGALAAAAIAINPWLVAFIFPPLLVLHRAVLVRQLEVAANTDGKTGLLNAAAWHTQAERELRRAERRSGPRAVLVIDLDHFKAVNDTHGHLAGDRVLAAVADALNAEVRDRDLVGRFGGEEFVVLLGALGEPGTGGGELQTVAERIRSRIAALRVEMPTADGPLTVAGLSASVGCALYPDDGRELRDLLQVADTALYAAKRAGRNVVRMGIQPPAPQPLLAEDSPQGRRYGQ